MFRRTLNAINLCVRYCSSHASTSSSSANFTDNYHYADSYNSTDCNIIEDTQQTHALVDQNFYDDSDVDQNLCGDDTAELCNSNSQPEVLPKTLSRKDVYAHENDIKIAKSVGIGIDNTKLESQLIKVLFERSFHKTSLSDLNIALFNFHSTRFAERLIKLNVGSLCLVESSNNYALAVKEFAKNARKSGRYVEAYRANFDTLFPSKTKKKRTSFPTKLLFGNKSLISDAVNPFKLKKPSKYDEEFGRVSNAPVIIGTLSTVNQQLSMIDSLTTDLMLHLCRLNSDTVFKYGSVQLITFLTAGNYAMLLSSIEPSLKFLARAFRHRSWFINKIFNIRPIVNMKRIHRNAFQPHFPLQKTIAHEKKLADLNISNGFLYGITIQPKEAISIGAMNLLSYDSYDNCEEFDDVADVLMKYAFWTKITGKLTINCKLLSKLREWFPHRETDFASFISDETKLSQLSMQTLDEMFVVIYKFLAEEECTIRKEIEEFTSKFKPVPADKKFAD